MSLLLLTAIINKCQLIINDVIFSNNDTVLELEAIKTAKQNKFVSSLSSLTPESEMTDPFLRLQCNEKNEVAGKFSIKRKGL